MKFTYDLYLTIFQKLQYESYGDLKKGQIPLFEVQLEFFIKIFIFLANASHALVCFIELRALCFTVC